MALFYASMAAAWKENKYRDAGIALPASKSRSRTPGPKRPAGSKMLARFYKAKHGIKPRDIEEARRWYAGYLAKQDAAVRRSDANRKADRAARRNPLALAA